jgi:leucyl-tRNA synthetase
MRLYEMFMGPLEATKPWSMKGVEGVYRFLSRVWRLAVDDRAEMTRPAESVQDVAPDRETLRKLHQAIQKVTEDLDGMRFNTAIVSPFAPHLGEELWRALGHAESLAYEPWPKFDPALAKEDLIEVPVQVNGKVRSKLTVPADVDDQALEQAALADERIRGLVDGKQIRMVKVVPKKLVNIVVAP